MKILVVDDHALVREGLCQVLQGIEQEVEVLQAGTCAQAFDLARANLDLDLMLLDYHLPDMTGLQALRIFGLRHPDLPVLMLSATADLELMRMVLQAGASGFATKSSVSAELVAAVRQVLAGGLYLPQELRSLSSPGGETPEKPASVLTQRQESVLQLLLDGRSNSEISASIGISQETVKTHIAAILRHFEVQNRTQAVVAAARAGFLPSSSL